MRGKKYNEAKPKAWSFWHLDFIPKGCITLLVGAGGSGKSTFMSWLADNICKNGCRVAIVSNEETLDTLTARANPATDVTFFSRFDMEEQKKIQVKDILEILPDYDVIFVDSFRTITDIDVRYSHQVEKAFDPFISAVSGTDKSIIFLHHPNKGGGDSLQDVIAGSERMVSIVRHCDLTIKDDIENRRIITVAKSNCFSDDPGSHSFIIQATDQVMSGGGIVKVVEKLIPFREDLEEVIWRNSRKGKEARFKKNLAREVSQENKKYFRELLPKGIEEALLASKGKEMDTDFVQRHTNYQSFARGLQNTGSRWITKTKEGRQVTYHWTDEALEWLGEQDEDYPF